QPAELCTKCHSAYATTTYEKGAAALQGHDAGASEPGPGAAARFSDAAPSPAAGPPLQPSDLATFSPHSPHANHPLGVMDQPAPDELIEAGAIVGSNRNELTCLICHQGHGAAD